MTHVCYTTVNQKRMGLLNEVSIATGSSPSLSLSSLAIVLSSIVKDVGVSTLSEVSLSLHPCRSTETGEGEREEGGERGRERAYITTTPH